ncbi:MAG: DEAD/DEAH box helicase, partial [Planctomycetota bacterium]
MPASPSEFHFPVRFAGNLRPTQQAAVEVAEKQLADRQRRIHIVAPPGSGKTVLGLYLWAQCVQRPAVVLSPNSAIQAQWISRMRLFQVEPAVKASQLSTDPKRPGLLTSLTYQSVTLPRRGGQDLDTAAIGLWQERLIAENQAEDPLEAEVWIEDLKRHNRDYYDQRLATYRKQVRDQIALGGEALKTLHQSALDVLHRLRDRGVGLLILDECHHLMGHWGRVLADAEELLEEPIVIGLTATPPDRTDRAPQDILRYDEFFGPVDFEVPVPAVVKDGYLAPYQDLAYFVRPASEELTYLATTDREFHQVVEELCRPAAEKDEAGDGRESLPDWAGRVMAERILPTGKVKDWTAFERRDPELARSLPLLATARGMPLPEDIPPPDVSAGNDLLDSSGLPRIDLLVPVLDRYIRHRLQRSDNPADHELAQRAIARLRVLGVQITETGPRPCASPVGRVMAYSRAKTAALLEILKAEQSNLGGKIRVVVIADYEKTSAVSAEVSHLLDEEAGGAVAAFRALLSDPETDRLDPVLVTGSTVLVDDDLAEQFKAEARNWLRQQGIEVELAYVEEDGFHVLTGRGDAWCPRV